MWDWKSLILVKFKSKLEILDTHYLVCQQSAAACRRTAASCPSPLSFQTRAAAENMPV